MAMVLDTFLHLLGVKLGTLIEQEVAIVFGVREELKRLQSKLSMIEDVVDDAEKKAFHDKALRRWTNQLKDVMYDADDIIDEFRRKLLVYHSNYSMFSSCIGRLALHHHIGRRIRNVNLKLEEISKERSQFQLVPSPNISRRFSLTCITSALVESDIVGTKIEEDTKMLVGMLTKEDKQRRNGVLVYAIVGIGGIGKTTLAQRIHNDPFIKSSFPIRTWICVSREVSEISVLKEILSAAGVDNAGVQSHGILESMVEKVLSEEKFLLVLDDVWSEQVWEVLLRNPLQRGASGSRVLVTTRNEGIAMRMKAIGIHQVQLLPPEDGWSLICKKVALNGEEGELVDLKDIGLEIVKKCDGLPLAIRTIGGVLCTKDRSRRAWEKVLQSTAWSLNGLPEGVKGALYLSYEDLPPHLKQCFLYCSLFPHDHLYLKHDLVRYWISEGFVIAEGDLTVEDIGEGYYRELVQRSLLQPESNYYDLQASKMHDLQWSLAQFLTQGESLVVQEGLRCSSNLLAKPRRISVVGVEHEEIEAVIDALKRNNSLRTLLTFYSQVRDTNVDDVTKTFMRLRVLELGDTVIEKLPYSIGNLAHLRYLNLSGSNVRELPKSIENLVNLEFLILQNCKYLKKLGEGVVKLQNLRCLDLDKTEVEGMPVGIGGLRNLNTMFAFVVNNNKNRRGQRRWSSLEEVESLSMLRRLSIQNMERTWTSHTNDEANIRHDILKNKEHLLELRLSCTQDATVDEKEMKRIEEVFELVLCPPPGLDLLLIKDFYGINFPSWMASNNFTTTVPLPNLRYLDLKDCSHCAILPPLGNLPSLDFLSIRGARSVVTVGVELLGQKPAVALSSSTCSVPFPKLTSLVFLDMPNWEKWEWEEEDNNDRLTKKTSSLSAPPRLNYMMLFNCPKLRSLPMALSRNATSLTKMLISYCGSLTQISGFACLRELTIDESPGLEHISDLPALQHLRLKDYAMESLPEWLLGGEQQFPALQKLEILAKITLLRRCLQEGSQECTNIQQFPHVYGCSQNGSRYFSYTRSPEPSFNTNLLDEDNHK